MGLKSKVGLVAAKALALRINLNIQGCSEVAPSLHAPSVLFIGTQFSNLYTTQERKTWGHLSVYPIKTPLSLLFITQSLF